MLRSSLGSGNMPRLACRASHVLTPRARAYHSDTGTAEDGALPNRLYRVRLLRPALWCFAAVGTIYFGLAAIEVRQDAKNFTKYGFRTSPATYEELAAVRHENRNRSYGRSRSLGGLIGSSPLNVWRDLPASDKVIVGNIAVNTSIWAASSISGTRPGFFLHVPILNRNFTMLTSVFGHVSGMHLLFNMYCLYNFGPAVARTPTFQGSGSHLAAFYLSSGVLASLASQIEAKIPSRNLRAGQGASGAIMALISVYAMSYPQSQIGIIFLPGSVDAQLALGAIAVFETYGLIFGIPWLRVGHSAHLGGLAVGAAYMYFDGKGQIWNGTRRLAFNQMRRANLI